MSELLNLTEETNKNPENYDELIYSQFSEIGKFEAYEHFNGDKEYRAEQKRQFLTGEIDNPTLDYPNLDLEKVSRFETELVVLKKQILDSEQNEVVKQTYRWRINEKIAEARMLQSAAAGDMRRFNHYSEFIYGKPSADVFAYTVNAIKQSATTGLNSENSEIAKAAAELITFLPKMEESSFTAIPSVETINLAQAQTEKELGGLINIPDGATKLDSTQIKAAFDSAIDKIGDGNWKVIIEANSSKTAVSVSQEDMKVKIPSERSVTKKKLAGLIVHEIGTHVARRVNGERSKLKLLSIGLDRYDSGEEGIATMREQAVNGKAEDFRGIDGMLAIGSALGVDGQPRDFREVFNILEKYHFYENLASGKEIEEAKNKAQDSAWTHTVRAFRGTDCKTKGACLTKDIVYRNGNIGIWDVIKNNPDEMLRFNIGKYDPANGRHLWILEQLGITDQDLDNLK